MKLSRCCYAATMLLLLTVLQKPEVYVTANNGIENE